MPQIRFRLNRNRYHPRSRGWSEPTNYCLDNICEVSLPGTDVITATTSLAPSQPDTDEEELNRHDKRSRASLTAYPATLHPNAKITIHSEDGHITTQIDSQLQSKGGRAFVLAEYGPYGELQCSQLYIRGLSGTQQQPQWAFIPAESFKQMGLSSRLPSGRLELRILVEPEWVNDPRGDQSNAYIDCTGVAEVDLSRRLPIPEDWNPDVFGDYESLFDANGEISIPSSQGPPPETPQPSYTSQSISPSLLP